MTSPRSVEFKVGVFVVVGLVLTAGLIIRFGQYRPGQKAGYEISVLFPNAAGLIKEAKVMYAGIPIGKVHKIELTGQKEFPVRARLLILADKTIPNDAGFTINQSGLLGDRFVDVSPGAATEMLRSGESIKGLASVDLNEAVGRAKVALDQAGRTIEKLDQALQQLNETVLSKPSLDHAANLLANADVASSNVVLLVTDLQQVVTENRELLTKTLGDFRETSGILRTASKHADELIGRGNQLLAGNEEEIKATLKNLADTSARLDAILASLQQGTGTVGRLLVDATLHDELVRLVQNWRQHGLLYKEGAKRKPPDETPLRRGMTPVPARPAAKP